MAYGTKVRTEYKRVNSVVGEVETAPSGAVILRVGREVTEGQGSVVGWVQTEHVVLTPEEALDLAAKLQKEARGA